MHNKSILIWTQVYQQTFEELQSTIIKRLEDFSQVKYSEYFYEILYCLCTPQSKAIHAEKAVSKLQMIDFENKDVSHEEITSILRNPEHYIRFHNVKSTRILTVKDQWGNIFNTLCNPLLSSQDKRVWLVGNVSGFGWKEASHFLRNIGHRNLAILDRHLLKHLVHLGLFTEIPAISPAKRYLDVEARFLEFCSEIEIPLDEVDLLFWSLETGFILK